MASISNLFTFHHKISMVFHVNNRRCDLQFTRLLSTRRPIAFPIAGGDTMILIKKILNWFFFLNAPLCSQGSTVYQKNKNNILKSKKMVWTCDAANFWSNFRGEIFREMFWNDQFTNFQIGNLSYAKRNKILL